MVWTGAAKAQATMHDVLVPWDKKRGDQPVPPNPAKIDPQNDMLLKPFNQVADQIARLHRTLHLHSDHVPSSVQWVDGEGVQHTCLGCPALPVSVALLRKSTSEHHEA